MHRTMMAAACCAMALASCGDDTIPLDEFIIQIGQIYSQKAVECGVAETTWQDMAIEVYGELLSLSELRQDVDSGRVKYDGVGAKDCLEKYQELTCLEIIEESYDFSSCAKVLQGQSAVGSACYDDECVSEAYCDSTAAVCPGQCRARKGIDETAGSSKECQEGLVLAGLETKCARPAELGEACSISSRCQEGLRCDTQASKCVSKAGLGESCDSTHYDACKGFTDCTNNICSLAPAAGEACQSSCRLGAFCDSGICRLWLEEGAACTSGFTGLETYDFIHYYCQSAEGSTQGTLTKYAAEGESCSDSEKCSGPLFCDETKKCAAEKETGSTCQSDDDCESDSCVSGKCVATSCELP